MHLHSVLCEIFDIKHWDINKEYTNLKYMCVNYFSRAIFRWITWMDLNQLDVDESVNPESPLGLLRGIKYGTESYHDLFKRLCRYFATLQ